MDPETPEADAAEQERQAVENGEDEEFVLPPAPDADPADLADQQRSVPEDDPYERG